MQVALFGPAHVSCNPSSISGQAPSTGIGFGHCMASSAAVLCSFVAGAPHPLVAALEASPWKRAGRLVTVGDLTDHELRDVLIVVFSPFWGAEVNLELLRQVFHAV